MPKQPRTTTNPLGKKFLEVMKAKSIEDDYVALAEAFKVKVPSVYDWIDHGRFSKARYAQLVAWSGRSLDWWFDVPQPADGGYPKGQVRAFVVQARDDTADGWPFVTIEPHRYKQLPKTEKRVIEAYARGVLDEWEMQQRAKSHGAKG